MRLLMRRWVSYLLLLTLCACAQREDLAPVVELNWKAASGKHQRHVVVRGETLYAVAFRYDKDYRELARLNQLQSPYILHVGQVLRLAGASVPPVVSKTKKPNVYKSMPKTVAPPKKVTSTQSKSWVWPVYGRVVEKFIPTRGKKGINIAGKKGDKVRASAAGVVAYAGNGLSGYGNLIIIKHNHQFLTAYGNNIRNLVREGQYVRSGQIIAEMGVVDRRYWGLHFEIRKAGKPVNPLSYLQKG
ncbi:peptidoglycan DD-metalloendopeptidase family protein [Legionella nagasakiensis]|uniref:peptidoglycan DD-metalloendopeptidase family protein n=1 Tax=Legionella nagasakiensis TaxID=535290 RepID=UPI0010569EE6|nr:peptidoglycan DD-metalloendopeptidase family protein [Legionella nagasakiensis]